CWVGELGCPPGAREHPLATGRGGSSVTSYDVHAHGVPEGLIDTLRRDGDRYGVEIVETDEGTALRFAGGLTTPAIRPDLADLQHRLETMDRGRVDVQLFSSWIDLTAYS